MVEVIYEMFYAWMGKNTRKLLEVHFVWSGIVNLQVTCHCLCFVLLVICNQPTSEEDDQSR